MTSENPAKPRLAYIDWMRGLACLLMFQTHCYDSWLTPQNRQTTFFMYSQLGGTFPAPMFLFLAGVSFALVTDKLLQKNLPATQIAGKTILRGAEILGFGFLFRLQEYVVAWGWAPASDLLRVDILNTIGMSMILMGILCWFILLISRARIAVIVGASATALLISLATPLLWTTWRPTWLPWPIEAYIDGAQKIGTPPAASLFPIFPWAGFAFAGLALGFILQTLPKNNTRKNDIQTLLWAGAAGLVLVEFARWLDKQPIRIYPVDDYWHTSPSFFLIRVGMLLMILTASYAWCRWGAGQWRVGKWGVGKWKFSPVIQLGQASLLVYWVHIEFVYGRVSILPKRAESIWAATGGLAAITAAMLILAYARTRLKRVTLPSPDRPSDDRPSHAHGAADALVRRSGPALSGR
jgi:uncharacterized membrane protein